MTEMDRRRFMFGAGAVVVASAVDLPSIGVPVLYADGEHDDTEAFPAFAAGKPFRIAGTAKVLHEQGSLTGGTYKLNGVIRVKRHIAMNDMRMKCGEGTRFVWGEEDNLSNAYFVWADFEPPVRNVHFDRAEATA